jgi:hypothetical protein
MKAHIQYGEKMCSDLNKRASVRVRSSSPSPSLMHLSISLVLLLLLQESFAWTTSSLCWRRTSTGHVGGRNSLGESLQDDQDAATPDVNPRELQQSMNDLFRVKRKAAPINQDPARGYSLTDLEDYFSQRKPGDRSPARPIPTINNTSLDESFPKDGGDGLYLDPDLYVKSKEWLNPDGSLNLPVNDERLQQGQTGPDAYQRILRAIVQPAPNSPDSFSASNGDIQNMENMEDLWEALQQKSRKQSQSSTTPAAATSEELHRQVFAEEQGYLQQSQVFRESLTDASKAGEATALRHGQQFRQRQAEAIASLDQQIKEWEEGLESNFTQAEQLCAKCQCILLNDEMPMVRKHKGLCQVCYGELLVAKSKFELLREEKENATAGAAPRFRSRLPSRTTLARPQITSPSTDLLDLPRLPPMEDAQAKPTATSSSNPSQPQPPPSQSALPRPISKTISPEVRRIRTGQGAGRTYTFRPRLAQPQPQLPTSPRQPAQQRREESKGSAGPRPAQPPLPNSQRQPSQQRREESKGSADPRPAQPLLINSQRQPSQQRREESKGSADPCPIETFRADRAQAPPPVTRERTTEKSSKRTAREIGDGRLPPVSKGPTTPPRNWPQRPTRPTGLDTIRPIPNAIRNEKPVVKAKPIATRPIVPQDSRTENPVVKTKPTTTRPIVPQDGRNENPAVKSKPINPVQRPLPFFATKPRPPPEDTK